MATSGSKIKDKDSVEARARKIQWIEDKKCLSSRAGTLPSDPDSIGFPKTKISTELVVGDGRPVSSVIMEKQKEVRSCALVVGRRGKSKSVEFLFGSVSNALVHSVNNCLVWIIEPTCGIW